VNLFNVILELVSSPWAILPTAIGFGVALLSYFLMPNMPMGFHIGIFGLGALVGVANHFVRLFDRRE